MPRPDPNLVLVRAIDEGNWSVYGPYLLHDATVFREALEVSGAFDRVEIHPAAEMCDVCGWRTTEGHDLTVHREWDNA